MFRQASQAAVRRFMHAMMRGAEDQHAAIAEAEAEVSRAAEAAAEAVRAAEKAEAEEGDPGTSGAGHARAWATVKRHLAGVMNRQAQVPPPALQRE